MSNAVLQMQDAGFSREQVEAITTYIDSGAASKADIERLEGKISALDEKQGGSFRLTYWMLALIILVEVSPYLKALFA